MFILLTKAETEV